MKSRLYDAKTPLKEIVKIFNSIEVKLCIEYCNLKGRCVQAYHKNNKIGYAQLIGNEDSVLEFSFGGFLYRKKLYLNKKYVLTKRKVFI